MCCVESLQGHTPALAAPFFGMSATGVFDEESPHGLRRGREEMPAAIPAPCLLDIDKPEIRFVNKRSCLNRLPPLFASEPGGGQLAELVIDQRQQLFGCRRITRFDLEGIRVTSDIVGSPIQ